MVGLDLGRFSRPRFDHVGIERALHEEARLAEFVRLFFERADELLADYLALVLRIRDPGELRQEALLGLHMHQGDVEVAAEGVLYLVALVLAHQPVVHEDAGELLPTAL